MGCLNSVDNIYGAICLQDNITNLYQLPMYLQDININDVFG